MHLKVLSPTPTKLSLSLFLTLLFLSQLWRLPSSTLPLIFPARSVSNPQVYAIMPSFCDARVTSSSMRYRAEDYHTLTNRRASSPPSPDLENAAVRADAQPNYRRPVTTTTPDKRVSASSTHTAPCTLQGSGGSNQIRHTPRACVKEDFSCKNTLDWTSSPLCPFHAADCS